MRGPGLADFGLDVGKPHARGRIGDADEMIAGRTLDLSSGVTRIAFQRLIAMRAVEFEFGGIHDLVQSYARLALKA